MIESNYKNNLGFTAAEMLVTLFVASIFLIAGYQLFVQVTQDSKNTNEEAQVSGIVYERLRKEATENLSDNCPYTTVTTTDTESISGYPDVDLTITTSCVSYGTTYISHVSVTGKYAEGTYYREVTHSTYVD